MAISKPARKLASLHLIAKPSEQSEKLSRTEIPGEWTTGNWKLTLVAAQEAVGADLHLHEHQSDVSWMAGRIVSWSPAAAEPGRVVFRFVADRSICRKQLTAWGREQARVRDEA